MTAAYRKKLIEVALPLKAINAESAREKSIRHGHPSTLHLWWARRPLAACRAVLFASLVNDPDSDPMYSVDESIAANERAKLFNLIEDLVKWENSNNPAVINKARAEIARSIAANKVADGHWTNEQAVVTVGGKTATAHEFKHKLAGPKFVNAFLAEHAPPVLDPFAGGGSIPLEAQRLGLRAYASDLNPVAVLINKALIEIPPKFAGRPPVNPESRKGKLKTATWAGAQGLAEDVRYYGNWMRDEAEKRIGHLYPKVEVTAEMTRNRPDLLPYVGRKLTVIAWLWARTVASPNPACGCAHTPLARSFWLSTKKGKEAYIQPVVDRKTNEFEFRVRIGKPKDGFDPGLGTVNRRGGRCVLTGDPMPFHHIRSEGQAGRMKLRLMAVVVEGIRERLYLNADNIQVSAAMAATPSWQPDAALPDNPRDFKTPNYGITTFADLFTTRQLVALTTFSGLVTSARDAIKRDAVQGNLRDDGRSIADGGMGPTAYADAVATYLAFAVSKASSRNCSLAVWEAGTGFGRLAGALGRQALPMQWVFAETNPLSGAGGDISGTADSVSKVLDELPIGQSAKVMQLSATEPMVSAAISTDPPYYDNICYADLSDFFYVWLRRSLLKLYPGLFGTVVTPKSQELIASPYRHDGSKQAAQEFFEQGLGVAFARMRDVQDSEIPLTVFYAFKQSETGEDTEEDFGPNDNAVTVSTGWETMLEGLIHAGFSLHGTWPMRTEAINALKKDMSALASSIVLVCRPRPENASLATRKEFITALRHELPEALRNLQHGNIAPVDLAQAAIGPGMAVFTRYGKVLESDGSPMTVRTALGLINQTLDEVLAEQEGEFDGDTRWALAWFEQFGLEDGPFGDAETLSKAKNTAVRGLVEAGLVVARAGKVRLVRRDELPADWDPRRDRRLTVWETTQHLIRTLETQGEMGTAALLNHLGGLAAIARDLAYRLYSLCERKKWAEEALAYNSLVIAWPELTKLAIAERGRTAQTQREMF